MNSFTSISLTFVDPRNGEPQPCWVSLTSTGGEALLTWKGHSRIPTIGRFEAQIPAGRYRLLAHGWMRYSAIEEEFDLTGVSSLERTWKLQPWLDLKERGYFCVDSHNHIIPPNTLEETILFAEASEVDAIELCQTWSKPEDSTLSGAELAEELRLASSDRVLLRYGMESPKKRFSHLWWMNITPPDDPFGERMSWHDAPFVDYTVAHPGAVTGTREAVPFQGETSVEAIRKHRNAAAIAAHPTSWWMANQNCFITNIATDLSLLLLSGYSPAALVIMGYDCDQIFYQNVWFHLLNLGYSLTGIAETDGSLGRHHPIGHLRTYFKTDKSHCDIADCVQALRSGKVIVSSGPFLEIRVDGGSYGAGDHITTDGEENHRLTVTAWAQPLPDEFISLVVLYCNGRVHTVREYLEDRPAQVTCEFDISTGPERSWYVVKVYGSSCPAREFLDLMSYAEACEFESHDEYKAIRQVAISNPVYFEPRGWEPPAPVKGRIRLEIVRPDGRAASDTQILVADHGDTFRIDCDEKGCAEFQATAGASLEILSNGQTIRRHIFPDYPPLYECLEYAFGGSWKLETENCFQPGQAPWRIFQYERIREIVSAMDWRIELPESRGG